MDLSYRQEVTLGALVLVGFVVFTGFMFWLTGRSVVSKAGSVPVAVRSQRRQPPASSARAAPRPQPRQHGAGGLARPSAPPVLAPPPGAPSRSARGREHQNRPPGRRAVERGPLKACRPLNGCYGVLGTVG